MKRRGGHESVIEIIGESEESDTGYLVLSIERRCGCLYYALRESTKAEREGLKAYYTIKPKAMLCRVKRFARWQQEMDHEDRLSEGEAVLLDTKNAPDEYVRDMRILNPWVDPYTTDYEIDDKEAEETWGKKALNDFIACAKKKIKENENR